MSTHEFPDLIDPQPEHEARMSGESRSPNTNAPNSGHKLFVWKYQFPFRNLTAVQYRHNLSPLKNTEIINPTFRF